MTKKELIDCVKALDFSADEYIVIGSGILVALDIRRADDVDLVVSERIFRQEEASGEWKTKNFEDGSYYLTKGVYELGLDWDSKDCKPNLADLKQDQIVVDGIPFVSLERLKKWKQQKGNEKSLKDIELINKYQTKHSKE